jgi:mannosyltransferase
VSHKRSTWLFLLVLVAAGAALRFYMLGVKSFWLDEVTTVDIARLPWRDFLRTMWWGNANMALYYSLLRSWLDVGDTEFRLRTLSALFGLAAIPAIYALGNRFLSRKVGLISAVFLTLHGFHIQYSQELRGYSLVALLLILSSYAFLQLIETPERKSAWILYVLLSTLAIYSQMFAVFVLASQWLVLTPVRIKRLGILRLLSAAAAIGVVSIPLAVVMIFHNQQQMATWREFYHAPTISDLLEMLERLVGGKAGDTPNSIPGMILLVLYVALWILALSGVFRRSRADQGPSSVNAAVPLLAWWLVFPIVTMFCLSFMEPIFYPRYLLMCVPGAVLLAAQGFVIWEERLPRAAIVARAAFLLMILLAICTTAVYYKSFKAYGNDWQGVTRYLLSKQEPGDAIVFYTFTGHREFEYYVGREREAGKAIVTPDVLYPISLDRKSIEQRSMPYRRVWLVLHQTILTPGTDQRSALIASALGTHFRQTEEKEFSGAGASRGENGTIRVALYAAAPPK